MRSGDLIDLLLLAALWGGSFLFMRMAVPEFGPWALMWLRTVIAGLLLLPLALHRGGRAGLQAKAGTLLVAGIFNSAVPFVLFAFATLYLTAGFTSILNATAPFFALLIARVVWREPLQSGRVVGLVLGLLGVMLLVRDRAGLAGESGYTFGLLAIGAGLLASFCYGVMINSMKRSLAGVDPLVSATGTQLAAALVLTPLAITTWPQTLPTAGSWLAVLALAVACTASAYMLYFRLLRNAGTYGAIGVTFLIPVFGMIWGYAFLNEAVTWPMLLACVLIGTGLAFVNGLLDLSRIKSALFGNS